MRKAPGLYRLLSPWRKQKFRQAFATLLFFLGLLFSLLAGDLLLSVRQYLSSFSDKGQAKSFLVVGKKITSLGLLRPELSGFSPGEEKEILESGLVNGVYPVLRNAGPLAIRVNLGSVVLGSEIFFEALPKDLSGTELPDWSPESKEPLPLLLPRSFLALYNLGYASGRGLPLLHEKMISQIPLEISWQDGSGRQFFLPTRITGLGDRFTSFLVPESFLTWFNRSYFPGEMRPLRLVLETDKPDSPELERFLIKKDYEVQEHNDGMRTAANILQGVTVFFIALGLLLLGASLTLFLVSLENHLSSLKPELEVLLLNGFSPRNLKRPLLLHYGALVSVSAVLALAIKTILVGLLDRYFRDLALPLELKLHYLSAVFGLFVLALGFGLLGLRLSSKVDSVEDA